MDMDEINIYRVNVYTANGSVLKARAIGRNEDEAMSLLMADGHSAKFFEDNGGVDYYTLEGVEKYVPVKDDPSRYIMQEGSREGWWVATDKVNNVVFQWRQGEFDGTRKITMLDDMSGRDALECAKILRELSEWLVLYHYEKLYPC